MKFRHVAFAGLAAAGIAALGGITYLLTSLPQEEGRVRAPGLEHPVEITRDDFGIPRIKAETERDAYFALGWVHAQDRLWQMESQRRAGAGRLSEIMGVATLDTDKFLRTLGLYRLAEQSFEYLDAQVQAALEAYAAGVNAWIAEHKGALPPEFILLGHKPEPWRPADSLVWARLMGLQLAGNWRQELLRARMLQRVPAEKAEQLWTPAPPGSATTLSLDAQLPDGTLATMLAAIPEIALPHLASNEWVLSGERTETGKPLLANDPHLGFQAPILWYLASLECPQFKMHGATVPGVPFHVLGHNGRVAWGFTTTDTDMMDLFVEKEGPPGTYLTPQGPMPFETHREVIGIKDQQPLELTVRATRHGPLISDVLGAKGAEPALLSLSSATLLPDDRTAQALYFMARTTDWRQFVEALKDFHAPQQNIAYADTAGDIGFYVPGRVPIRKAGDGLLPRPGWTGDYDWVGWVPFEQLPQLHNPPQGMIVNANNQVVPSSYPYLITAHWPEPFRAQRIMEALQEQPRHTLADMARLQLDTLSPVALRFKQLLALLNIKDDLAREAAARLQAWDGRIGRDRPEPLILEAWLMRLQHAIIADDLGDLTAAFLLVRPLFLEAALAGNSAWCADCTTLAARTFAEAVEDLAKSHGAKIDDWRWGRSHKAVFEHGLFRHVPGLDRISKLSIATDGDDFTVNRGTYRGSEDQPYNHVHGAGLRALYDLGDLSRSRFIIATGQSGNILSPHYDDMLERWRDGDYVQMMPVADGKTLTLEPSP